MGVIYQIVIEGGSRTYIGSAHRLPYRQRAHLSLLRRGLHHCRALQNAFAKYGEAAVTWVTLETVGDRSLLIEREQVWLDQHKGRLYNKSPTAASRLGATMSDEARAKISASLKGNQYRKGILFSDEERARISNGLRAAYASGKRKPVSNPQNLKAYNDARKRGEVTHPRSNPERERAIIADYLETKEMEATARNFGVTGGTVDYYLRKNGITKFRRTNYAKTKRIYRD